jgi:hypothetical protein
LQPHAAEYIIKIKTILQFLKWTIIYKECGVDCTFFADYFFKAVLTGNNPPLPGGKNSQKPITRVMEALRSLNLWENFRLLERGLNEIKGEVSISGFQHCRSLSFTGPLGTVVEADSLYRSGVCTRNLRNGMSGLPQMIPALL